MYDINETHDPNLRSWVESANDPNSDFPIQNLPFCLSSIRQSANFIPDVGVRIGESIFLINAKHNSDLYEKLELDGFVDAEFFEMGTAVAWRSDLKPLQGLR